MTESEKIKEIQEKHFAIVAEIANASATNPIPTHLIKNK